MVRGMEDKDTFSDLVNCFWRRGWLLTLWIDQGSGKPRQRMAQSTGSQHEVLSLLELLELE